jgi:glycosyltransferase involved in cell wall biosynthesis
MTRPQLKLAIEGLGATQGATDGAGRYLLGLLTALGRRPDVRTTAYVGPSMRMAARRVVGLDRVVVLPTHTRLARIPAQHFALPLLAGLRGTDVAIYTSNYAPVLTFQPSIPITQNMFLVHPAKSRGPVRAAYRRYMRSLIATRARSVIAVSNLMARELEWAAPRLAGRIYVVHPAIDLDFFNMGAQAGYNNNEEPYFLAAGTVWPHRNFDLALRALKLSPLRHRLLIAGATPRRDTDRLSRLADELEIRDRVRFLGVIDPDDMPSLYSGATALVATSITESFGIPVIEAMAAGTPVIAVRRTVYPETVGDAGILIEATPLALARAMVEVTEPKTRRTLIAKGHIRASSFNFARYADQLVDICRSCV